MKTLALEPSSGTDRIRSARGILARRIWAVLLAAVAAGPARAQYLDPPAIALNQLRAASSRPCEAAFHRGVARELNLDVALPDGEPASQARAFLAQYAGLFGGASPDLALVSDGRPTLISPGTWSC